MNGRYHLCRPGAPLAGDCLWKDSQAAVTPFSAIDPRQKVILKDLKHSDGNFTEKQKIELNKVCACTSLRNCLHAISPNTEVPRVPLRTPGRGKGDKASCWPPTKGCWRVGPGVYSMWSSKMMFGGRSRCRHSAVMWDLFAEDLKGSTFHWCTNLHPGTPPAPCRFGL